MALKLGLPPKLKDFNKNTDMPVIDMWFETMTKRSNAEQTLAVATLSAPQALVSGVVTKVLFNTATINTDGFYKTASSKFIPTVAGYYQFDSQIAYDLSAFAGTVQCSAILELNGGTVDQTNTLTVGVPAIYITTQSFVVAMNGTSDFVELYGFQNTGGNRNILTANTFLRATLVRAI